MNGAERVRNQNLVGGCETLLSSGIEVDPASAFSSINNLRVVVQNCRILSRVTTGNGAIDASVLSTGLFDTTRRHRLLI